MVRPAGVFRPLCNSHLQPLHIFSVCNLLIAGLFFIAPLGDTATAATYYVDAATGDDGKPGTSEQPWKTVAYALGTNSPVGPGDAVYLRGGNYREQVDVKKYGTPNNWITVKSYPGETAVLDGTDPVTGWTQAASNDSYLTIQGTVNPNYNNIYWMRVKASNFPTNLSDTVFFEDRVMARIASDPDQSVGWGEDTAEFRGVGAASEGQNAYLIDPNLNQNNDYWNGAFVHIHLINDNASTSQRTVADFVSADHKLIFDSSLPANILASRDVYRIINHPHILNSAGEFYVSNIETVGGIDYRRIYYWPKNTSNLTDKMTIGVRSHAFVSVTAVSYYLNIENLTVFGAKNNGIDIEGSGGTRGSYVTVKDCIITDCGNIGILYAGMNNVRAEGNYVRRNGNNGIVASGVDHCVFKGNDSGENKGTGIDFYDVTNGMIINNILWGIRGGHGNGTAVYGTTSDITCEDILLAGNQYNNTNMAFNNVRRLVVFGNLFRGDASGPNFAITAWSSRYDGYQVWMNNTAPIAVTYALFLHPGRTDYPQDLPHHYVTNNVFYGLCKGWDEKWDEYDPSRVKVEDRTYNAYTYYSWQQDSSGGWYLKEGEQDCRATPLTEMFVNPAYPGGDYHPKAGSSLIGAGKNIQGILSNIGITDKFPEYDFTKDLAGKPWNNNPSIGCYEYRGPVLENIGDQSVFVNNLLTFSINATDPDGDPITYSAQSLPAGATFVGQTFSWTPTDQQAGTYQVKFIASDGTDQDSETITITVRNAATNRPPVLAPIGNKLVGEGATLSFTVSASDADGDAITYSVQDLPSGASFASPRFSWTPAYNQAGTYQVTFTASDGLAEDSETITITVENVNRPPVLGAIGAQSVFATDPLTFSVTATDADGDSIQYSANGLPSGATFSSQTFTWTPTASQVGTYSVTFIASDGSSQDSETITITVYAEDNSPPAVANCSPAADAIQVPVNSLVTSHIVDAGQGIDASTVTIKINGNVVYTGDTDLYNSQYGRCYRSGTKADYEFTYQVKKKFGYEQEIIVTVDASDLAQNRLQGHTYSFWTEMRSFGKNKKVSTSASTVSEADTVTVCDSSGNIWAAWHAGLAGSRDVYLAKLAEGASNFGGSIQLTTDPADQCNPAIALDGTDKLYVVWQDNRRGNWDIYVSTSVDGTNWSAERRITDSNDNEINPAIAIDRMSPNRAHLVWQDDRAGNQDIYIAISSDGFATKTVSQITSVVSDQTEPAITIDSGNTVYVVWADLRDGTSDIYGAGSSGSWTNKAVVSGGSGSNQSSPAIAAETAGSILHLLWVDDTPGNKDIFYAATEGLPGSPLTGSSIIDPDTAGDQLEPAIAVIGSTDSNLAVFACWQDWRNVVSSSADTDIYFVEITSDGKTNVFVDDDGTNANQSEPAMSVDRYGYPYIVWADSRSTSPQAYYVGSTYLSPEPLASQLVSASSGAIVGTNPANITSLDDVSIVVPAGACSCDMEITISRIMNPPEFAVPCLAAYDFGPSGIQFTQPVTITIPYAISGAGTLATPYWFNSLTGALSQQGITDIRDIVISPTLHALSFKTTHFTAFYVMSGSVGTAATDGGGGGGGCALSASGDGSVIEFLLPYLALAGVTLLLKLRDGRNRRADKSAATVR